MYQEPLYMLYMYRLIWSSEEFYEEDTTVIMSEHTIWGHATGNCGEKKM